MRKAGDTSRQYDGQQEHKKEQQDKGTLRADMNGCSINHAASVAQNCSPCL
jgi:hypothetical protein